MRKNIRCQRAYSLIEVSSVLIILGGILLAGAFFYQQISLIAASRLIAKQFNQIANSVANYSWPEYVEPQQRVYSYDIEKLKELGVISAGTDFKGNNYIVDLYWYNKNSYTMFIYKKINKGDVEEARLISEFIGSEGGWFDIDDNGDGYIHRNERNIFIRDEFVLGVNKLPRYTPFLIRQEYIYQDDDLKNIKETFFSWGKETKENQINENELNKGSSTAVIDWYPAYIDDRVVISWEEEKIYKATIKDQNNNILNEISSRGVSFDLIPSSSWIGKEITLHIQIGAFSFERKYNVQLPLPTDLVITDGFNQYNLDSGVLTGPYNFNTGEDDAVVWGRAPLITCLRRLKISPIASSVSSEILLQPLVYDVFLSYSLLGKTKNISVSQGLIKHFPYQWENQGLLTLSYNNATSNDCGILSENVNAGLYISANIVFYWMNTMSEFGNFKLKGGE